MSKSIFSLAAGLVVSVSVMVAQTSNALHSSIMANPLIAHPAVFRELQDKISDEIAATEPGAQLAELYKILAEVRLQILNAVYFELSDTTNAIAVRHSIKGTPKVFLVTWVPEAPDAALNALRSKIADHVEEFLSPALSAMKPKTRDALLLGVIESMKAAGIPGYATGGKNAYDLKTLAIMVAIATTQELQLTLDAHPTIAKQDGKKGIIEAGNKFALALRTKVADALTAAESRVREAVSSFSKVLLAANSGLSIREGVGSFAGGLHLSLRSSSKLQWGLYINGQFNKTDSTVPTDKLVGGQMSVALSDNVQFDALASALFRGEVTVGKMSYEAGVGLLYRSGADYVISAELFNSKDFDQKRAWMLGLGFRSVVAGSPSLLIGWPISPTGKLLVQFSIPVLGR
jgi:hypothetical protein